jgi:hypothetical protein
VPALFIVIAGRFWWRAAFCRCSPVSALSNAAAMIFRVTESQTRSNVISRAFIPPDEVICDELQEPSARGENGYPACSVSRNFVRLACRSCAANSIDLPKWNLDRKRKFQSAVRMSAKGQKRTSNGSSCSMVQRSRRMARFDWRILATRARDAESRV